MFNRKKCATPFGKKSIKYYWKSVKLSREENPGNTYTSLAATEA
jgi:hypothetical protein